MMKLVILILCVLVYQTASEVCGVYRVSGHNVNIDQGKIKNNKAVNVVKAMGEGVMEIAKDYGSDVLDIIASTAKDGVQGISPLSIGSMATTVFTNAILGSWKRQFEKGIKGPGFELLMDMLAIASPFPHTGAISKLKKAGSEKKIDMDHKSTKACGRMFPKALFPLLHLLCEKGQLDKFAVQRADHASHSSFVSVMRERIKDLRGQQYDSWWPALFPKLKKGASAYTPHKLISRFVTEVTAKSSEVCGKLKDQLEGKGEVSRWDLTFFLWAPRALKMAKNLKPHDVLKAISAVVIGISGGSSLETPDNYRKLIYNSMVDLRNEWETAVRRADIDLQTIKPTP